MKIIIGDSWGVGEWDKGCLSGPGFGQYLMLHDRVLNLSVGAASNTLSLDRLDDFLRRYTPDPLDDTFFWIVTSPSRCQNLDYFLDSIDPYQALEACLATSLRRASDICQRYNIKIKLIGGLCDLHGIILDDYPGLEIAVESWGQLLHPDYKKSRIDPYFWTELGEKINSNDTSTKQNWLSKADESLEKFRSWESMKQLYFSTDGSHPDRHAHLVLRNHLFPE